MTESKARLRNTKIAFIFLAPALLLFLNFFAYPVIEVFRLSFFRYEPLVEPEWIGLENYRRLVADPEFRIALANSFLYLIVVPIITAFSLGLAVLVEPKVPAIGFFRAAYYVPVVTTMVVVGISWRFIFSEDDGLLNHLLVHWGWIQQSIPWMTEPTLVLGTVMTVTIWKGLGYYMVIFIAALRSIPQEVVEAAIVDGASPSQVFWKIKFPLLWPAISLVLILSSIAALQVFDEIYVMTNGKIREAITVVYYIYETGFRAGSGPQDYGYASAMAAILFFVLLGFSYLNLWVTRRAGYQGE
jgi:putative chitobiose transport system permease protein